MTPTTSNASALWPTRPFEVVVQADDGRQWTTAVTKPFARVGGLPHMEVKLTDADAPRRGLYLHATEEGIYCLSLEKAPSRDYSPNGWIPPKGYMRLGSYKVSARFTDGKPVPPLPSLDLRTPLLEQTRMPYVVVRTKTGEAREAIDRPLTLLGSKRPSRIRLDHPSISSTHCVLYWDRSSVWVVDLHSSRGTLLDGDSVAAARIRPGQTLTLGTIDLQVELSTGADDATPVRGRYLSSRDISNDEALERLLRHFKTTVKRDA